MPTPVQINYLKYLIRRQKTDGNSMSPIQPSSHFLTSVGLSGNLCRSHYLSDYPAVLYLMALGLYHPRMEKKGKLILIKQIEGSKCMYVKEQRYSNLDYCTSSSIFT